MILRVVVLSLLFSNGVATGNNNLKRKFVHHGAVAKDNDHLNINKREPKRDTEDPQSAIHLRTRKFLQEAERLSEENTILRLELLIEESMSMGTASPTAATSPPIDGAETLFPTFSPTLATSPPIDGPETLSPSAPPVTPPDTLAPTLAPITSRPSGASETMTPTNGKIQDPTDSPTKASPSRPSQSPTQALQNSRFPTATPSLRPTNAPTKGPTQFPSQSPITGAPSATPTMPPTGSPSSSPTSHPTRVCNMSPEARESYMQTFIELASDPDDVNTEGTPQNKAANWIIYDDAAALCPQADSFIQRYVMAVFYFSTGGNRWVECQSPKDSGTSIEDANAACTISVSGGGSDAWLTPGHECNWGGIGCDSDGESIEKIEFESNSIAGTLPFEMRSIQSLEELLLERGAMTGTIPKEFGSLRNLQRIDLDNNLIEGSIPTTLYSLTNLRQFDINDNSLTGTISTLIGQLGELSFFQVNNNRLTGTIPSELGKLSSLEVATLDNNNFQGSMPTEMCSIRDDVLRVLTTDCLGAPNRASPPFVSCDCCSACF